jgi:hypothetical protein
VMAIFYLVNHMTTRWSIFWAGHWTKEMPQTEGLFTTATREGLPGPYITIVFNYDEKFIPSLIWDGWWWSEPLPDPIIMDPRPPSW